MQDYITLGPTPAAEPCAQINDPDYHQKSKKECRKFMELLLNKFGTPPVGAKLKTKDFHHDFGIYTEVVCYYDEDNETATEYCLYLECNTPEFWE